VWIFKWISDRYIKYIPKRKDVSVNITTLQKIHKIEINSLRNINRSKYQLWKVSTLYHSISQYSLELGVIVNRLSQNIELENKYRHKDILDVPIYEFYQDRKQNYINPVTSTKLFLEQVAVIFQYIEDHQKETTNYVANYNLRILKYIVNNLTDIINLLYTFSEKIFYG
jgi:hypothetical protein